jgi:aryl-alcohol dehydrogenase-like predicted oxidoreductase
MRYRVFGHSGLRVSELGLGTLTFGNEAWGSDEDESRQVYTAFREAGGNFIDTANVYSGGRAESFVGEFMANERDLVVVGTKYSIPTRGKDANAQGNSRKNMMNAVHASLRRLKTDYIDLYWVHARDETTPIEEVMRGLDDLVRQGKILYAGISDTPAWQVARGNAIAELRGWTSFAGLQVRYSLLDRDVENEFLPMANALDLAVTAWESLAGGVLTGKFRKDGGPSTARTKADEIPERAHAIVAELVDVASDLGCTPAQAALSWVRGGSGVIVPIVGARTKAQLEENLACLNVELSDEHRERLDKVSATRRPFPHDLLEMFTARNVIRHRPTPR